MIARRRTFVGSLWGDFIMGLRLTCPFSRPLVHPISSFSVSSRASPSNPPSLLRYLSSPSTGSLSLVCRHVFTSAATPNKTYKNIPRFPCYQHISLLYLYSQTAWKHYLDLQSPTSLLQFSLNTHVRILSSPLHSKLLLQSVQWPPCCHIQWSVFSCSLAQPITLPSVSTPPSLCSHTPLVFLLSPGLSLSVPSADHSLAPWPVYMCSSWVVSLAIGRLLSLTHSLGYLVRLSPLTCHSYGDSSQIHTSVGTTPWTPGLYIQMPTRHLHLGVQQVFNVLHTSW